MHTIAIDDSGVLFAGGTSNQPPTGDPVIYRVSASDGGPQASWELSSAGSVETLAIYGPPSGPFNLVAGGSLSPNTIWVAQLSNEDLDAGAGSLFWAIDAGGGQISAVVVDGPPPEIWAVGSANSGNAAVPVAFAFTQGPDGGFVQSGGTVYGFDGGGVLVGALRSDGGVYVSGYETLTQGPPAVQNYLFGTVGMGSSSLQVANGMGAAQSLAGMALWSDGGIVVAAGEVPTGAPPPNVDALILDNLLAGAPVDWSTFVSDQLPFVAGKAPAQAVSVAIDPGQNQLYEAVAFTNPDAGSVQAYVASFSADGTLRWKSFLNGTFARDDSEVLALDSTGVYVATTSAVYKLQR